MIRGWLSSALVLLLCSTASTSSWCASPPSTPVDPWSPESVQADLKTVPRIERIYLDSWIGGQLGRGGMDVGLSLVHPMKQFRPALQVASNKAGVGISWTPKMFTVLDVGVGVNYVWDLRDGQTAIGAYVTVFKF